MRRTIAADIAARRRRRAALNRRAGFLAGDPERAAAAAGRDDVRVLDLEAGAGQRVDVVDLRAVDVLERLRLDQQAQAVALEDPVVVALLVEGEVVLEARAAAAADADAQAATATSAPCDSRYSRAFSAPCRSS